MEFVDQQAQHRTFTNKMDGWPCIGQNDSSKNIFYFVMEVVANVIQGVIFKQYLQRLLPLKISAFTGSDQKNLSLICKKSADMSRHASVSHSLIVSKSTYK